MTSWPMSQAYKILFSAIALFGLLGGATVAAHPWAGLVIDDSGTIYFTFICPVVDEDHHACVWQVDGGKALVALHSASSPSDIILTRSYCRTLFAAERRNAGTGWQARLWQYEQAVWKSLIAPTMDPRQFHIQAYAVNEAGILYFARDARLFAHDPLGKVNPMIVDGTFDRIDALAWGPGEWLYVIDKGALRILDHDGNVSTLTTGLKEEAPADLPFSGANILFDLAVDLEMPSWPTMVTAGF